MIERAELSCRELPHILANEQLYAVQNLPHLAFQQLEALQ
jgi:hypothetical protein